MQLTGTILRRGLTVRGVTTRLLLGGLALDGHLQSLPGNGTTPNKQVVAGINSFAAVDCDIGEVACGNGCMPLSGVCCDG